MNAEILFLVAEHTNMLCRCSAQLALKDYSFLEGDDVALCQSTN